MKTKKFILLLLITGIVSEFIHPGIQTWVPVSVLVYVICGLFAVLAICFRKNRNKLIGAIMGGVVVFTEYVVVTAVAYWRMVDTILDDGIEGIVFFLMVAVIFVLIAFWNEVKAKLHTQKK